MWGVSCADYVRSILASCLRSEQTPVIKSQTQRGEGQIHSHTPTGNIIRHTATCARSASAAIVSAAAYRVSLRVSMTHQHARAPFTRVRRDKRLCIDVINTTAERKLHLFASCQKPRSKNNWNHKHQSLSKGFVHPGAKGTIVFLQQKSVKRVKWYEQSETAKSPLMCLSMLWISQQLHYSKLKTTNWRRELRLVGVLENIVSITRGKMDAFSLRKTDLPLDLRASSRTRCLLW